MTSREAALDIDLVERIAAQVDVPLVLHGSSGVPAEVLGAAIRAGIRKVNVGTALNVAYTGVIRQHLADDARVTDPRKFLVGARVGIADEVASICSVLAH
ncbi:hypothetical protein GCM10025865_15690 [Paraoerskovia sediminicola]|uniref:Fructose-bisphosphate aldolase class II n=2 Tax=Paraoerskovia sediminicola TaxID=1138587 RepID=A0ABM8G2H7_9CELL|nr:hypothetical protein GCM10025865_15690 [Paraoerskovia sediminicola]